MIWKFENFFRPKAPFRVIVRRWNPCRAEAFKLELKLQETHERQTIALTMYDNKACRSTSRSYWYLTGNQKHASNSASNACRFASKVRWTIEERLIICRGWLFDRLVKYLVLVPGRKMSVLFVILSWLLLVFHSTSPISCNSLVLLALACNGIQKVDSVFCDDHQWYWLTPTRLWKTTYWRNKWKINIWKCK